MPQRKITINREQTENSLRLYEATMQLKQSKLQAHIRRGITERQLVRDVFEAFDSLKVASLHLAEWESAHKAWYDAEAELLRLAVAQDQSEATLLKAMLEEGENPTPALHLPGVSDRKQ